MTREEARKAAEVMLAYADGKEIEWKASDIHTCAINYAHDFCSQKLSYWTPGQAELEFLLATAYAAGAKQVINKMQENN